MEWEEALPLSYAQRGLIDGKPYNCEARDISDGVRNKGCPWKVLTDKCNVFDDTFYVGASRPLDAQHVLKDGQTIQVGGGYTISTVEEFGTETTINTIEETTVVDEFKRPNVRNVYQIDIVREFIDKGLLGIATASSALLALSLF